MKSFSSALKQVGSELVAIYTDKNTHDYYVGQIVDLNREKIKLKLIDKNGKQSQLRTFKLSHVDDFYFMSKYTAAVKKKAIKNRSLKA